MKKRILILIALTAFFISVFSSCTKNIETESAEPAVLPDQTQKPTPEPSAQPTPEPTFAPIPEPTPAPTVSAENENISKALVHLGFSEIKLDKEMIWEELAEYIVKLRGAKQEAEEERYQHPYEGVSEQRDAYVGYVYARRLFTISSDTFSGYVDEKNALCIMLRLLGYSDGGADADFPANNPYELASKLGIFSYPSKNMFRGEDVAALIWKTTDAETKDGDAFIETLVSIKVFSKTDYTESQYLARGEQIPEPTKETAAPSKESNKTNNSSGNNNGGGTQESPVPPANNSPGGGNPAPPANNSPGGGNPAPPADNNPPAVDIGSGEATGDNTTAEVPFG